MNPPRCGGTPLRPRPLVGGVSMLLLVAFAVAGPAGGYPLLATIAGQAGSDAGIRAWSGTLASVVRSVARRASIHATVRPAAGVTAREALRENPGRLLPDASVAGAGLQAGGGVRVELLDLPPPRA